MTNTVIRPFLPARVTGLARKASTFTETHGWFLAFKDITASTNVRTMIAAVVPQVGCGHTLPVLIPAGAEFDAESTAQVLANLNSFGFDYVTRQKVQATHLTWYIVEQLPVIAAEGYDRRFGDKTARELVRDHALRLTYTANDMAPFARDLGFDGPPFIWDEEERRHLRARLDALYFHLYGLSREDTGYVLDTFPIVRRQDEAEFGSYRTRDLIIAYMNGPRRRGHRDGGVGVGQRNEGSMRFTPRFSITNAIAAALTEIERARGFLDAASLSDEWIDSMRSRAFLLEAHHTTHIEGTRLTIEEAADLLAGDDVPGADPDDTRELLNYRDAFKFVSTYLNDGGPITERLILEIHKHLVAGVRGGSAAPGAVSACPELYRQLGDRRNDLHTASGW